MAETSLIFPMDEFRDRTRRLQSEMGAAGLDAILLTSAADVFWITGFLTRFWESPARPWFIVVPSEGDLIAVIPSIGAHLMGQTWVRDIRTWDAPDPRDDGVHLLADALNEAVPEAGVIGVPMGLETQLRMPLADFQRVQDRLGSRRMADGTAALQRSREIKSAAEVEKIQQSCAIAGRAFDKAPDYVAAGRGLDAVFRDFQVALLKEGADWVSYVAGAAGQGGYADVISPATSTPITRGDVLMLDTGAVRDGYFCDFDRNFAIGPASDDVRRAHAGLWEATQETIEALRPGMRACDVHAALATGLKSRGLDPCGGRLGHGLGVSLTEWPSFTPLDHSVLRDGMVLTLEPSASVSGTHFLVHEECVVLGADGAELLSPRASYEMVEIAS